MFNKKLEKLVLLIILIYLVVAFVIVKDYGVTYDEPENFAVGEKYFYAYQTGTLTFMEDIPKFENHPDFNNDFSRTAPHRQFPLANILSAITCYLFYQKTGLLDPISAHHIIIPILLVFLIYALFVFVAKYWGDYPALIAVLSMLTYPRFFGHSFNNIKDIPEIVFFSVTIFLFVEWVLSKRIRFLYFAFISWGFALATKMDAVLIPIILFLWLTPAMYKSMQKREFIKLRTFVHLFAGFTITMIVFIGSFPPLILPTQVIKIEFIKAIFKYIKHIGNDPNISWNLYAPLQTFYATPVIMMILFFVGLWWLLKNRTNNLNLLIIIWLLLPIVRHCFPGMSHYDGLRHFLVFIIPFSIILAQGVIFLAEQGTKFIKLDKKWLILMISLLFLAPNLYSLVTLHPYQTTYFSSWVGGLKGAQEKDIIYSCDYWLNSYREASEWLGENAIENSYFFAYPFKKLFSVNPIRSDLKSVHLGRRVIDSTVYITIPKNTYIVVVPRKWSVVYKRAEGSKILKIVDKFKLVYQVRRQKGEIMSIYYVDDEAGKSMLGSPDRVIIAIPD